MRREPLPRWVRLLGTVVVAIIAIPVILVTFAAKAKDARR